MIRCCNLIFLLAVFAAFSAEPSPSQVEQAKRWIDQNPEQAKAQLEANPQMLAKMSPEQQAEVNRYIQDAVQKHAQKPVLASDTTAPSIAPSPFQTTPVVSPAAPALSATITPAPAPSTAITPAPSVQKTEQESVREVYGRNLFNEEFLNPQYIEIPNEYVIAPGDEILLRFWGSFNQERKYTIGDDGYVFIEPLKRQAYLLGMTLGGLKAMVQRVSSASPGVEGDVRIVNAHPLYAHVTGNALHPGTVSAPAYYTFWQFLMMSKGPSDNGSVRDIRVSRKGKEIAKIDIYDFLRSGRKPVIAVQNEDLIFFGEAKRIVYIDSFVRRPGLYELKETERLGDLVAFGGGFASTNFSPRIQIKRTVDLSEKSSTGFPYQVIDVDLSQRGWEKTELRDGDEVLARSMVPLIANDIYITGHGIAVPGRYSLPQPTWTADDLVRAAGGLVKGAHRTGELLRLNPDRISRTTIPLDLSDAAALQKMYVLPFDSMITYHDSEFVDIMTVETRGFVRRQIEERYTDSLTLADVIRKSEGVRDGALPYVYVKRTDDFGNVTYHRYEIADPSAAAAVRLSKRDEVLFFDYKAFNEKLPVTVLTRGKEPLVLRYSPDLTLEVIIHELGGLSPLIDSSHIEVCAPEFKSPGTYATIKTCPLNSRTATQRGIIPEGSIVFLRQDPNKDYGYYVSIEGEVVKPGRYPLLRRDSRLSDIFALAGGLTQRANKWGITITREKKRDTIEKLILSAVKQGDIIVKKRDTISKMYDTISKRNDTITKKNDAKIITSSILINKGDTIVTKNDTIMITTATIPVEVEDRDMLTFTADWILEKNDQIQVARNDYDVSVMGAVFDPRIIAWNPGYGWKDYVKKSAGGTLDTADVCRTYIQYPNGITRKAHSGWWIFSSDAMVYPGSRITVPFKPYKAPELAGKESEKTDYAKLLSVASSALLSVISLIVIMHELK